MKVRKRSVIAISGIDTDIGKTAVTGMIARSLLDQGRDVFTQKMVQTGCVSVSEDILEHRRIMNITPTGEDLSGLSCPYLFPDPCSPHLAAELSGTSIDSAKIFRATEELSRLYDILLVEGAGGLSVPLTLDYTFLDYLVEYRYPLALVSSPRLGSINHTLNAMEILSARNITLVAILYNLHGFFDEVTAMVADSRRVIQHYMEKLSIDSEIIDVHSPFVISDDFKLAVVRMLERGLTVCCENSR